MIDETTIHQPSALHGAMGPAIDNNPRTTHGRVRPFIWGYLLLEGGVRREEVAGCLVGHVAPEDIRPGFYDDPLERSRLECVIDDALAYMLADGLLRIRADGLYVLTPKATQITTSIVCVMNAQMPDHLLHEIR